MYIEFDEKACYRIREIARTANESGAPPSPKDVAAVFTEEQIAEIVDGVDGWGRDFGSMCEAWCADYELGSHEDELLDIITTFFEDAGFGFDRAS